MGRKRDRQRKREEKTQSPADGRREDCPCPKTDCKNHGFCAPCRDKHRKSAPYCEHGTA